MNRKCYGSTCCAVGCTLKAGTNLLSTVKMIRFPQDPERRLKWEAALNRKNWKPKDYSVICNKHFITGQRSDDPQHPDYVPSIFEHNKKGNDNEDLKIQRFNRSKKRKTMLDEQLESTSVEQQLAAPKTASIAIQTELTLKKLTVMEQGFKRHQQRQCRKISTYETIANNAKQLQFYTKIRNFTIFISLFKLITSAWSPKTSTSLRIVEQFTLVVMKLRLGLMNEDIGYRFGVHKSTVGKIFKEWIIQMASEMSRMIYWPSNATVSQFLPACFKNDLLKNVISIIDCSEIFIDIPFNLDARSQTYSSYKGHNTVKFLISISPSGCITFISRLYGGRHSDKSITAGCGILDLLKKDDVVLADRGFRIDELLMSKGARVITPSFTKGKSQLTAQEVSESRLLSKARVHVERAIQRIKCYRILKNHWQPHYVEALPETEFSLGDLILQVLSGLCNVAKPALLNV